MDVVKKGTIALIKNKECPESFALQVTKLDRVDDRKYSHECTDGVESIAGVMTSAPVLSMIQSGTLKEGSVIRVREFEVDAEKKLRVTSLVVVGFAPIKISSQGDGMEGVEEEKAEGQENRKTPDIWQEKTPNRRGMSIAADHSVTPLEALNPYGTDWKIKVKVSAKLKKRSFTRNGEEQSVFNAHVVDENGTQAEVTFWREQADKYYDLLEVDKVYIMSKFTVKPANKTYSTLAYDYALSIDRRGVVEECADQDTSKMKEHLEITKISQLHRYLGRQALVSVMGVVVGVGAPGTVKRKSDSAELPRRDITIVDESKKSVVITFWSALASDSTHLDNYATEHPVVTISACRVTDFNGLSLNTTSRSQVNFSPDMKEAKELKSWYKSAGSQEELTPIGEGMPMARQAAPKRKLLEDIQPEIMPSIDAKAQYSVVYATIAHINPEQSMVYLANTENQRKVVEQGDEFYCESDGRTYPKAEYRYVMNAKVADCTGECWVSVFNEQAREILGMNANDMFKLKNSDSDKYRAVLAEAQWHPFVFRTASKAREDLKTQEIRMRHSVVALHSFDWTKECRTLLNQITEQMQG